MFLLILANNLFFYCYYQHRPAMPAERSSNTPGDINACFNICFSVWYGTMLDGHCIRLTSLEHSDIFKNKASAFTNNITPLHLNPSIKHEMSLINRLFPKIINGIISDDEASGLGFFATFKQEGTL